MQMAVRNSLPRLDITYHWPRARVQQEIGHFSVDYSGPTMIIDQQEAMNELGMGNLEHLLRTKVIAAKQEVLEGIARRAREGDRFAREMTAQDTVVQLAKEYCRDDIPEVNLTVAPQTRPRIIMHYQMQMQWNAGKFAIDWEMYPPKIDWILGEVKFTPFKGNNLDIKG